MTPAFALITIIFIYNVFYIMLAKWVQWRIADRHPATARHIIGSGLFAEITTSWNLSGFILLRKHSRLEDRPLSVASDFALAMLLFCPVFVIAAFLYVAFYT